MASFFQTSLVGLQRYFLASEAENIENFSVRILKTFTVESPTRNLTICLSFFFFYLVAFKKFLSDLLPV